MVGVGSSSLTAGFSSAASALLRGGSPDVAAEILTVAAACLASTGGLGERVEPLDDRKNPPKNPPLRAGALLNC